VLGAEMYQGYLFSPGVPAEQAEAMLREPAAAALQSA
jgi:EAL domain-containing protein (putative c-di-GMP-specific phosphodiesterase class I)